MGLELWPVFQAYAAWLLRFKARDWGWCTGKPVVGECDYMMPPQSQDPQNMGVHRMPVTMEFGMPIRWAVMVGLAVQGHSSSPFLGGRPELHLALQGVHCEDSRGSLSGEWCQHPPGRRSLRVMLTYLMGN